MSLRRMTLQPAATIWGRLLLSVVVIACIAAMLMGAGLALVLRAERDFATLAQESIPRVALAGELAEFTGTLAALSAGIIAGTRTGQGAPELPATQVAAAARGIAEVMSASGLQGVPQAEALVQSEAGLRSALAEVIQLAGQTGALTIRLQEADEQLRWTQVDLQDQASALLEDLSFNMDSSLRQVLASADADARAQAEALLVADRQLRDRLQQLATDSATLAAFLLQARAADNLSTLEQVERLGLDVLDALALARADLPARMDIQFVFEAVDRLVTLAQGEAGIFALMRNQIGLRDASLAGLGRAQAALGQMQSQLSELGKLERSAAQQAADDAARRMLRGATWLAVLSVVGAGLGLAILLVFVRNRIVRPIHALTGDLLQIADAETGPDPSDGRGQDEIARMGHAVGVFRASVADLHSAHDELAAEVAERRRAVERLERTQRDLVQAGKMAALGQMSAAISHEINQPLAAMQHRLAGLRRAYPDASTAVARLEALVQRITGTISRLRRIARRAEHRMQRVVLADPFASVLELLDHRLRETGTRLEGRDCLAGLAVVGDEILIEQVLLNVLGNAIDAIEETGGPGVIRLAVDLGDDITIAITDTGAGLHGRTGADLVDPFFTTKEVGKGLGLGLSIAFNVMQDMGGFLEIGPAPEGGACVRLRLRAWQDEGAAHA